jgi:ABC-type bacteriocin/lantibiotic exporter with double-glycine peptidase domain
MLDLFKTFIHQHRAVLAVYVVILCCLTLERVAIPHFYGQLLETIKAAKFDATYRIFALVIGIFLVFQVLDTVLTYIDANLMPRFEAYVRTHIVDTLLERYQQQHTELDLGNITSKLIKLPGYLNWLFFKVKAFLFNHVLSIIITCGYLFYCHPYLGSIFGSSFLVLGLLTFAFCRHCSAPSYKREDAFDRTHEDIQDILYNLQTVYVNRTEAAERARIEAVNQETIDRTREAAYCGIPYRVMFALLFIGVFAGITWTSIHLYRTKRLSLALLVSSFMVTFSILRTCISFYFDFDSFIYIYGGIQVVSDYLEALPTACKRGGKGRVPLPTVAPSTGKPGVDIRIDDVQYTPPVLATEARGKGAKAARSVTATATAPLFDGLTLTVPAGQHVAITGGIGSGKSTLAHILLKLQCVQQGRITLNGVRLRDVGVSTVRQVIQYVPQQPRLFDRTLWENLSYGNPSLRPKDVYDLLRKLELHDLEAVFRRKMYERVGKQGYKLSGGQRQMVFLMRTLFNREARVVILDEPTSALDGRSRDQVLKLIRAGAEGRTLMVITHDEELLHYVDRVVRLRDGRVISHASDGAVAGR